MIEKFNIYIFKQFKKPLSNHNPLYQLDEYVEDLLIGFYLISKIKIQNVFIFLYLESILQKWDQGVQSQSVLNNNIIIII